MFHVESCLYCISPSFYFVTYCKRLKLSLFNIFYSVFCRFGCYCIHIKNARSETLSTCTYNVYFVWFRFVDISDIFTEHHIIIVSFRIPIWNISYCSPLSFCLSSRFISFVHLLRFHFGFFHLVNEFHILQFTFHAHCSMFIVFIFVLHCHIHVSRNNVNDYVVYSVNIIFMHEYVVFCFFDFWVSKRERERAIFPIFNPIRVGKGN